MKKGYVLTLDALLALMVVMVVYTLIMGIQTSINTTPVTEFKLLHYMSEDTMQVLSEKGVLDQVCVQWALAQGNASSPYFELAGNISNSYLSEMIPPRIGYNLTLNNDTIVASNSSRLSVDASTVETHSQRTVSGYNTSLPTYGYVARARINNINVSYGSVFWNNTGCNWTIQILSGINVSLLMPRSYTGTDKCNYTNTTISYGNNTIRSAVNDAVYRLLRNNDTNRNGTLNYNLDPSTATTDVAVITSIRSISSPVEVQLVLWMS